MTLKDLPLGKNFCNDLNGLPKIIHLFHMLKRKKQLFLGTLTGCTYTVYIMYAYYVFYICLGTDFSISGW